MRLSSSRRLFHKLVPIDEAIEIIEQKVDLRPRGVEKVEVLEALGRVLAQDIYAKIDYPPFDRSEVDGYAVRAEDLFGASELSPVKLKIEGSINVGEEPKYEVGPGVAVEVATGAPMPRGSNAVVMEEHTHREGDHVAIYRSVVPLENVAVAGVDISMGELVLPRGTRLNAFELGLLSALGYAEVEVYLKPRIAVLSIGDEIVEPGSGLKHGQVYDYNGRAITAYLRSLGAEASYFGIAPDEEEILERLVVEALRDRELLVTSGGTSAGAKDIAYRVVEKLGEVLIHGLEVKPGKPTLVGVVEGKPVIGLPGFPFSATSRAITLLRFIVEKLSGVESPPTTFKFKARIAQRMRKEVGKELHLPVALATRGLELVAIPIPHRSGDVSAMIRADAIAILPRDVELVEEGSVVDVMPLRLGVSEAILIGSHDVLLPEILRKAGIVSRLKVISVGSMAGLLNVSKGYGDVAPLHLLDPETGLYNLPYVKRHGGLTLISGYRRRLVLAFQRGNPKGISGLKDLLRSDVRMVNRNKGSGTRTYIDLALSKMASEVGLSFNELVKKIDGYTYEVSRHTAVAAAIAQGRADVGVCVEYAAKLYGLDYEPLTWEDYDFAVNVESLKRKEVVKEFLRYLKTSDFRELLAKYPGYEAKNDSGEVLTT